MQHNPKLGGVFLGGSLAVLAALSGEWSKVLGVSQPAAIAGLVEKIKNEPRGYCR